MELEEKLVRLHAHVQEHPTDYQSVIAEMKMYSKYIEHERKQTENERRREVARIRKRRREHEEQRQRDWES